MLADLFDIFEILDIAYLLIFLAGAAYYTLTALSAANRGAMKPPLGRKSKSFSVTYFGTDDLALIER